MNFKILGLVLLVLTGCVNTKSSPETVANATVMITNLQRNSGGSGTILHSYDDQSFILTNAHVCRVARNGGFVITDSMLAFAVVSYVTSQKHDLCLIRVAANLHVDTNIAGKEPKRYDSAIISGHPHLLPTILTYGHFSGKHVVSVMIGYRDCTLEEINDPQVGIFCLMSGKLPDIRNYEAIVVSATIMPGSSGSAIYNSKGEISALVFAGQGDLGYAEAVPYEYISYFLSDELPNLTVQIPNSSVDFLARNMSSKNYAEEIADVCDQTNNPVQEAICSYVEHDGESFK